MIENVSTQLTVFHCFAHCLLPGRAFASLYALLFLEKEAEIGGREIGTGKFCMLFCRLLLFTSTFVKKNSWILFRFEMKILKRYRTFMTIQCITCWDGCLTLNISYCKKIQQLFTYKCRLLITFAKSLDPDPDTNCFDTDSIPEIFF